MELGGIKDLMRKRFSEQHRGKNIIGSIAVTEIKNYFNIKSPDNPEDEDILTGYIRNDRLFIKTSDQYIKIQLFKSKIQILKQINDKLSNLGYKIQINEIILK